MASTRDFKSPGIFAEDASTTIPPTPIAGVAYRDAVTGTDDTPNGWRYGTRVESQDWNQIMFLLTSMLSSIDKQGVLGWSSDVDYDVPAIVFGSDRLPYIAVLPSGPSSSVRDPVANSPVYWQQFALGGRIVISASGAWVPSFAMQLGYIRPKVTVMGAGGGGGRSGASGVGSGGGGGGGVASSVIDLFGVTSVSVTVGTGGLGATAPGAIGATGGTTIFGGFLSANGGDGGFGNAAVANGGGSGGLGIGGSINTSTGPGGAGYASEGGNGGGAGARAAQANQNGINGIGPGGGGSGARFGFNGGNGANGIVIIEW